MELTQMFSQNEKQLLVQNNFKFKFKYNSKLSDLFKENMQSQIGLKQRKYYCTGKIILDT